MNAQAILLGLCLRRRQYLALALSDKVVELKVVTSGIASRQTPAT